MQHGESSATTRDGPSLPLSVHFRSPRLSPPVISTPTADAPTDAAPTREAVAAEPKGTATELSPPTAAVTSRADEPRTPLAVEQTPVDSDFQAALDNALSSDDATLTDSASEEDAAAGGSTTEARDLVQENADDAETPGTIAVEPNEAHDDAAESDLTSEMMQPAAPLAKPLPPLTRQLINLRSRVRSVLTGYYRKTLNSRDHDPWEVMHGMLAYEVQSRIRQGGPRGDLITSVGWLCYNRPCKGQTLLHVTRDGQLRAKYGVGLQGHLGQLLAMLAQCHVSPDYPIRIGKHQFTIQDLIESEQRTCYPKAELTFKLLAFQYYLDLDETWLNDQGLEWDFPRLIREELAQPMRSAACGGTHRLSSLSLTLKVRAARGEPIDGEYARAAEFVRKYQQYAFRLQNRDGSLSTSWFNGRGDESDLNRRIKTTGHILEWLCYSLSDEELRDQRTIRAVSYLANLMYSNYNKEWEVGPMCHATHALLLYDERVFMPHDRPDFTLVYRPKRSTAMRGERIPARR
jgi:hypothetical protein